uniref:Uncharacterized protein n=1 Tax=Cacopsylla melanoneura TaxID=428564 RepID=A0A8D8WA86_9HEMI
MYNTVADRLCRNLNLPEWHLTAEATTAIFKRWGTPEVDLFACHRSAVVPNYVTLDPLDQQALFTDAFSKPWRFNLAWAFTPPALIPMVLQHLETATGIIILVTPRWDRTFCRICLGSLVVRASDW